MKVKKETVLRTIILFVAIANQILTSCGKNPLPFSEDEIYQMLSLVLTTVSALVAWWKNNSFTNEALEADIYMDQLREANSK